MYVCMFKFICVTGVRALVKNFAVLVRVVVDIAHGLGIFHRDISISNIFYDSREEESNRNIFLMNDWSSHHLLLSCGHTILLM